QAGPVPTNIREHIFNILRKKGVLKNLTKELTDLGYTNDEIRDELEIPKRTKVETKIKIKSKVVAKPTVIEELVKNDKVKSHAALDSEPKEEIPIEKPSTGGSIEEVIIEHLTKKKIIVTKAQFVNEIKEIGFNQKEIEKSINDLKVQGRIKYSRASPKGWSLT
ncbi:hypothetical protein LCGC14_1391270, partial [marine sediment metagenome]